MDTARSTAGSYPPVTTTLLAARGIHEPEVAERFLSPHWERDTFDPLLMKDMPRAVARILTALQEGERIAIWSDYDMDGIPGAVVLFDMLRTLGHTELVHHTPHRNRDGFGLNRAGLEALAEEGVSLVITVDCGIGDVEEVAHARALGLEIIVTDHHLPHDTLPEAYAIVNPKQVDCSYPEKMLCGAAVAFKLAQALLGAVRAHPTLSGRAAHLPQGHEKWLLDLVGMSTIADLVPLTGENRVLAHYGLTVLRKSRRPGLQALLKKARADQRHLTEDDIGFTIAPRVNAASRMGHAKDAFALLAAEDLAAAAAQAEVLERVNSERKGHVAAMVKEAKSRLAKRQQLGSVIVLGNTAWKPSLAGLVASALVDEYARPVFIWGREEAAHVKGSCRSEGTTNVHLLMERTKASFIEYGGHALSGGFSAREEELVFLEERLSAVVGDVASDAPAEDMLPHLDVAPEEVTWDLYRELARFAPFGVGNPKPVVVLRDVVLTRVRQFGKASEHLECTIATLGTPLKAIAFFRTPAAYKRAPRDGERVTVHGHLEASYFTRTPELRLRLLEVA